jgi:histone acetyltransferase (RNA polymerase elongator complex component)
MRNEIPRPFIVPVFIPHAGCPHQCIFCNQHVITGASSNSAVLQKGLAAYIRNFLQFKKPLRKPVQISFYGGNFLGLKKSFRNELLETAMPFVQSGYADGFRFSTRPDTITPLHMEGVRRFPVQTIELGVQSMDDRVLQLSRRGHTAQRTRKACEILHDLEYEIGLQMMIGLPGDTEDTALKTAERMAELYPAFVRIYPTVVLKNSPLADWYRQGRYSALSLEAAVALVKKLYLFFQEKHIPVIRMGIQASKEPAGQDGIVAGPYHPAFGHLVHSEIFLDKAIAALHRHAGPISRVVLRVHPRSISKAKGLHNINVKRLAALFDIGTIEWVQDDSLPLNGLRVDTPPFHSKRKR